MAIDGASRDSKAVSIVTCTNRRACMDSLLRNYGRQRYPHKELIVILNGRHQAIDEYVKAAAAYRNVRIYALPDRVTLGRCLNTGVRMSRHPLIAKFDDDDYYGPDYLADSVRTMIATGADIVGKRAHYMYLTGKKLLLHRYYSKAQRYVSMVQGATLLVKRHVFGRVGFPDRNRGECVQFCSDSRARGFKIYAGGPRHFIAMRRSGSKDHTWLTGGEAGTAGVTAQADLTPGGRRSSTDRHNGTAGAAARAGAKRSGRYGQIIGIGRSRPKKAGRMRVRPSSRCGR